MNKKVNAFSGTKTVFSFTASQVMKGKGFKVSTIGIAVIVALIACALCLVGNISSDEQEDMITTIEQIVDDEGKYEFETIKRVYLLNDTEYSNVDAHKLFYITEKNFKSIDKITDIDKISDDVLNDKNAVIMKLTKNEYGMEESYSDILKLLILTAKDTEVSDEESDAFGALVVNDAKFSVYYTGEVDEANIMKLSLPVYSTAINSNNEESLGMILAKIFLPMIFCLFLYMIILLHGQSITTAIVADKSSKLMEMLLTSVKPYAIIAGKILGTASVAIGQLIIWIVAGVGGFIAGNIINKEVFNGGENIVITLFNTISDETNGVAFSFAAAIIAIGILLIGFFFYCVFAGLAGSAISKVDDVSSANAFFQLPVVACFLISYLVPMANIETPDVLICKILRFVPFTSVFVVPSDILLGRMSILDGAISLGILIISCFMLIFITGKIYKNKLFNKK